jgi:hypothetical protein
MSLSLNQGMIYCQTNQSSGRHATAVDLIVSRREMDTEDKGDDVMTKRTTEDEENTRVGPAKGDFIAPPVVEEQDERADALPPQDDLPRN